MRFSLKDSIKVCCFVWSEVGLELLPSQMQMWEAVSKWKLGQSSGGLETSEGVGSSEHGTAWESAGRSSSSTCGCRCRTLNYNTNEFNLVRNSGAAKPDDFGLDLSCSCSRDVGRGCSYLKSWLGAEDHLKTVHSHGCGKRPQFLTDQGKSLLSTRSLHRLWVSSQRGGYFLCKKQPKRLPKPQSLLDLILKVTQHFIYSVS